MKKFINSIILSLSLLFVMGPSAWAQNDMKNIRALKVGIVLKEMNLSKQAEQNFLPLYNQYCDELLVVRRKMKAVDKAQKPAQEKLNEREQLKQQSLNIEKQYKGKFLKVISAAELEKMYRGEDKFRSTLLDLKKSK